MRLRDRDETGICTEPSTATLACFPFGDLPTKELSAWEAICDADERFANPFFRPELMGEIAAVRPGAEVAVLYSGEQPTAFFPFERHGVSKAIPVGDSFSDYHGIISRNEVTSSQLRQILNACRLRQFDFHHLPAAQSIFRDYAYFEEASPVVDLRHGVDGYFEDLRRRNSRFPKRMRQRARKLERDVGRLNLTVSSDPADFELMQQFKSHRCKAQLRENIYDCPWASSIFHRLLQRDDDALSGCIAHLRAGSKSVGLIYLIRSYAQSHAWMMTVNDEVTSYSPGLLTLYYLIQNTPELGIERIELARGDERFKATVQNAQHMVMEGSIGGSMLLNYARSAWLSGKRMFRDTPIERPAKSMIRWTRHLGTSLAGK